MTLDVYDPCPCGSGKKLKFCCASLAEEMQKVSRLRENNQPHMALKILERLQKSHPHNPWVITNRAAILLDDGQSETARGQLKGLLEAEPDHVFGIALYALAAFTADGYDGAKEAIHAAFRRCAGAYPGLVSSLAVGVASVMYGRQRYMAARQSLALAMRLASEEEQEEIFLRLLDLDGDVSIPYPLRSVHPLADVDEPGDQARELEQAQRAAVTGCWEEAAETYHKLAEQRPEDPALWRNAGLCRAWDGDETGAAEALHRAAGLQKERDFDTATEWETVAQLLDLNATDDHVRVVSRGYRIKTVSRVLSACDEQEQFVRTKVPQPRQDEESDVPVPSAIFQILDRRPVTDQTGESLTADRLPVILAQLTVYDRDPSRDEPAEAHLTGVEGEPLETALEQFREAAGDEIEGEAHEDDPVVIQSVPREYAIFNRHWYFAPETPGTVRSRLQQDEWRRLTQEVWPETPLAALDGKTPLQAADDTEAKLTVAAAVFVLDAYCNKYRFTPDLDSLRERLNVPAPSPVEVDETTSLMSFSAMQLHRLPVKHLSDRQLLQTLNRALLIRHQDFLYAVLTEVVARPACAEQVDMERAYTSLADICHRWGRRDEALQWTARGREYAESQEDSFFEVLHWRLQELSLRLEDPEDPELPSLLKHMRSFYGQKLPGFEERLNGMLQEMGVALPSESAGGIVLPEEAAAPSGEKKLWLPGQP